MYFYPLYFLRSISSCKLSKYRIKKKLCFPLHIKKDFCTRVPYYIYTAKKIFLLYYLLLTKLFISLHYNNKTNNKMKKTILNFLRNPNRNTTIEEKLILIAFGLLICSGLMLLLIIEKSINNL